jgi:hypothetical protein
MQVSNSLRKIEKSQRAFERDQDGIRSYDVRRKIELENRRRYE